MAEKTTMRDYDEKPKKKITAARIMRWTIYTLIIFIYGIFMVRIFMSCESQEAKTLYISPGTQELIDEIGADFSIYTISLKDIISSDGLYSINNAVYLESAQEFQITVRHKKSNLEKLAADYNTAADGVFSYILSDESGNNYAGIVLDSSERYGYIYERIRFTELTLDITYYQRKSAERAEVYATVPSEEYELYISGERTYESKIVPEGSTALRIRLFVNDDGQNTDTESELTTLEASLVVFDEQTAASKKPLKNFKREYE